MNTYWIIIGVALSSVANGMEMEIDKPQDKTCYIARLPKEIQDIIASYLLNDKENDQEFIERTKLLKQGNNRTAINYLNAKASIVKEDFAWGLHGCALRLQNTKTKKKIGQHVVHLCRVCTEILFSCSPDCSKFVCIDKDRCTGFNSFIIDIVTDRTIKDVLVGEKDIQATAISSCLQYIGILYASHSKYILLVSDVHDKEKKIEMEMPHQKKFKSIAFNKQGTKIIVHGNSLGRSGPAWHQIIPIVDEATQVESKKTLLDYFRQRGVCKDLNKSVYMEKK